ncbi:MAG: hypothetical protein LBG45_10320 [Dysgonamonadaceae bacterium]|nr:hypothetical protein [Dysgonamonadaceae bacterium]
MKQFTSTKLFLELQEASQKNIDISSKPNLRQTKYYLPDCIFPSTTLKKISFGSKTVPTINLI